MSDQSETQTDRNGRNQYLVGFLSAVLLFTAFVLLSQVAEWISTQPQPEGFFEFLQTPMFTLIDLMGVAVVALTVGIVIWGINGGFPRSRYGR